MKTPSASSRCSTRGFTLIELLTVIAIIGILAAIIIPTVGKVRESARSAQCASNQRQINMALKLYVDDNKGLFPVSTTGGSPATNWGQFINPYLPKRSSTPTAPEHIIFVCGTAVFNGKRGEELRSTYTTSAAMLGFNTNGEPTDSRKARPISSIDSDRTSLIPLILEGKANGGFANTFPSRPWSTVVSDQGRATIAETTSFDFRHGGRMNVSYLDGSVRSMGFVEFKELDRDLYEGRRPN